MPEMEPTLDQMRKANQEKHLMYLDLLPPVDAPMARAAVVDPFQNPDIAAQAQVTAYEESVLRERDVVRAAIRDFETRDNLRYRRLFFELAPIALTLILLQITSGDNLSSLAAIVGGCLADLCVRYHELGTPLREAAVKTTLKAVLVTSVMIAVHNEASNTQNSIKLDTATPVPTVSAAENAYPTLAPNFVPNSVQ